MRALAFASGGTISHTRSSGCGRAARALPLTMSNSRSSSFVRGAAPMKTRWPGQAAVRTVPPAGASHVPVAQFPVKNRPETGRVCQPIVFYTRRLVLCSASLHRHPSPAPHAEEPRSAGKLTQRAHPRVSCAASRSMRARSVARPHPSRRAHLVRVGGTISRALLRMRTSSAYSTAHDVKQPGFFVPAARFGARVFASLLRAPQ
jgi:hypothetical protein